MCQNYLFLPRHYTACYVIWIINVQSLLKFIAILKIIAKWELCAWCWLHISLIPGSTLVSFSLKSPLLLISSWFLLPRSQSAKTLNPHSTVLERRYFFSHSSDSHIAVPLILKWVFADSLAVTYIIPVEIALTLQINLVKVVESTKNNITLLFSNKIFIEVFNQQFHLFSNNCTSLLMTAHSFNQENWAQPFDQILLLHKLRNIKNPNIFAFASQRVAVAPWSFLFIHKELT